MFVRGPHDDYSALGGQQQVAKLLNISQGAVSIRSTLAVSPVKPTKRRRQRSDAFEVANPNVIQQITSHWVSGNCVDQGRRSNNIVSETIIFFTVSEQQAKSFVQRRSNTAQHRTGSSQKTNGGRKIENHLRIWDPKMHGTWNAFRTINYNHLHSSFHI